MHSPAAEGILVDDEVVCLECDNGIDAHRFQKLCHVARRYRVAGFRTTIFPTVGKVRQDSGQSSCSVIAQRGKKEQQPAQSLVDTLRIVTKQTVVT